MSYMHQAKHRLWFLHKGLKGDPNGLERGLKKKSAVNRNPKEELLVALSAVTTTSGVYCEPGTNLTHHCS